MDILSYLLHSRAIRVPNFLYFLLLLAGWLALTGAVGTMLFPMFRRKKPKTSKQLFLILVISAIIVLSTMTGKIAPDMAFGG